MTINPSDLHAVTAPVERARGLPNECYTDAEHFKREAQAVFFTSWAALGFASDVPQPGDVKPVSFLGQPLLLARDRDGTLRVFQNVCRHRGMILVEEAGNLPRAIRCPYHSWCYELDGRLRTTPHVGGPGMSRHDAIKREELGLIEVRSHIWLGIVFVNLDGKAPEFDVFAADALERYRDFDRPLFGGGPESRFTLDVASNWKLAIENAAEGYHLPWVHPGLAAYSRLEDHYPIDIPGLVCGQGTVVYDPALKFPRFAEQSEQWATGAEYPILFPNVMIGLHNDHVFGFIVEPVGPEQSREHVQIFYADPEAVSEDWAERRAKNAAQWKEIFIEDISSVEGMQRGRHAMGFDGGRFSPVMDSPTHSFHAWVAGRLGAGA